MKTDTMSTLICVGVDHIIQECPDLVVIFRCLPLPKDKQLLARNAQEAGGDW